MIGVFIQINESSPQGERHPVGYVICENGCWDWVGAHTPKGYGRYHYKKQYKAAHRVLYESVNGPVPDGLTIDHLCRNRGCVNPAHLEPVTMRENILRGESFAAVGARQTHCKHGHLLAGDNVLRQRVTGRRCRTCRQAFDHRQERRQRSRPWCAKCGKKYTHGCPLHS